VNLDGNEPADAEEARLGCVVGRRVAVSRNPVVTISKSFSAKPSVSARYCASPCEIAMWTCASELTERSANPNQRPSRNSLKPCFVDSRNGTRATEPASCP
jgi:hypothetical protein